jgi:hypothetical protein
MGWRAITRNFEELSEETHGRPVQAGEEGSLLVIAQEDFGRSVAVDLVNGLIAIDYERLGIQNETVELVNDKFRFLICEETNIAGEFMHLEQKVDFLHDEYGRRIIGPDGRFQKVRNDILTPLIWRPIWFTRWTNGVPVKVIGAQTTLPESQGNKNVKKMVIIYPDGRIGID